MGGAGYIARRSWRLPVTATGLATLSLLALYSATLLRGWSEINFVHHVVRVLVAGALLGVAIVATRRT